MQNRLVAYPYTRNAVELPKKLLQASFETCRMTSNNGRLLMSDHFKKHPPRPKPPELRRNQRHRLSTPPEAEILHGKNPEPIIARVGDLSRGGCFVETSYVVPAETEVTVILKKNGDQVRAHARVVRAFPNEGLGLEFISIEGNGFQVLDDWLSTFIASTWVAASRRQSQRIAMQIAVKVSGYNAKGARFAEETNTIVINSSGCSVILRTPVGTGQRLVLRNLKTNISIECIVAYRSNDAVQPVVGLGFLVAAKSFWPVAFPPADWSVRHPDAKRTDISLKKHENVFLIPETSADLTATSYWHRETVDCVNAVGILTHELRILYKVYKRGRSLNDYKWGQPLKVVRRTRELRKPFVAAIVITDVVSERQISAHTSNLSVHGCFVPTSSPLNQGAKVQITIIYAGAKFAASGRVVAAGLDGMSIAFIRIEQDDQVVLDRWLSYTFADET